MSNHKRARENRAIRQQALRDQLAEQCRLQHILENIKKMECLNPELKESMNQLTILKTANEQRLKLLNKYLPDLSSVTLANEDENPFELADVSDRELMARIDSLVQQITSISNDRNPNEV